MKQERVPAVALPPSTLRRATLWFDHSLDQDVTAGPPVQDVLTRPADQDVVTGLAEQRIVAAAAEQHRRCRYRRFR